MKNLIEYIKFIKESSIHSNEEGQMLERTVQVKSSNRYPEGFIKISVPNTYANKMNHKSIDGADLTQMMLSSEKDMNLASLLLNDWSVRNVNAEGVNLRGSMMINANLSGSNFKDADASQCMFDDSNLDGVNFDGTNLRGSSLRDVKNIPENSLKTAKISGMYLGPIEEPLDLSNKEFMWVNFSGELNDWNISNSILTTCDFHDCEGIYNTNMEACSFNGTIFSYTLFDNCNLNSAKFLESRDTIGVTFDGCDMRNTVFDEKTMERSLKPNENDYKLKYSMTFNDCDLTGSNILEIMDHKNVYDIDMIFKNCVGLDQKLLRKFMATSFHNKAFY